MRFYLGSVKWKLRYWGMAGYIVFTLVSGFGYSQETLLDSPKGTIKGRVIDSEIKSPVSDVKIRIKGTSRQAYTDVQGNFTLSHIPVDIYTLEFSCRYYLTRTETDVIVKSNRIVQLMIELKLEKLREEKEIIVTAGYFASTDQQSSSTAAFSYEEIRRAAGAAGDVSRIISGLPGIARVNDMMNNLVVRGGSPAENAFYIDNIEIPNINHYPTLGSTAGPIGLLNVDFIQDVRFHSGGFSPIYGNRLSSVMDISFREGNREEHDFQLDLSIMGLGMVAEGPVAQKRGSWMFSARRSYIDLLIDLMGSGVPVSWSDFQGKFNFDISPKNKLTFLGVLGIDDSGTEKNDALQDKESFYGGLDTAEHTMGVNWLAMWGVKGYSHTSVSQNYIRYRSDAYETVTERLFRQGKDSERILTFRNVNYYRMDDSHKFQIGLEVKHLIWDYGFFIGAYTDILGNTVPETKKDIHTSAQRYSLFTQHIWNPDSKIAFKWGLRADYYSFNHNFHLSPRISLSYKISQRTSLAGAAGVFYQSLPPILLLQKERNQDLPDPTAYHFVLGFRHLLTDNTRLSIEIYNKEYNHLPLDPAQPGLFIFDELFYGDFFSNHENLNAAGKARSSGIEIMLQKKLADKLYGVVSASYFRTRYRDFLGIWRNRIYDNRYIFAVEGGYKVNKHWQLGLKWNYAGGAPFTPFDLEASQVANSGIFDSLHINAKRLPVYHSLNIRMDKRFYFRTSNLVLYLSIWNILNRKNVASYYWNTIDNFPARVLGWGLLPAVGVEFEF